MTGQTIVLLISILSTGLTAGLLFGWLVSVIPGTRKVTDRVYVETMQEVNASIINPAFLAVYLLSPVFLIVAAIWQLQAGNPRRAVSLGVAAFAYVVGVLGVTLGGNVPLNNGLDAFDLAGAADAEVSAQRRHYETRWNNWHLVRTVASTAAFALAAVAPTIAEGEQPR